MSGQMANDTIWTCTLTIANGSEDQGKLRMSASQAVHRVRSNLTNRSHPPNRVRSVVTEKRGRI